jgi:hypothetical protein
MPLFSEPCGYKLHFVSDNLFVRSQVGYHYVRFRYQVVSKLSSLFSCTCYIWRPTFASPGSQIPRSSQNKVFIACIMESGYWQKLEVRSVSFAHVHDEQAVSHHNGCPSKLRVGLRFFCAYIGGGLIT